jgi:ParB-like chromosome segregation protein Spo0J
MQVMENVPLSRLKQYPGNPRRGNISMIAESLNTSGQYKPVLVQEGTNLILAGNHTVRAARKLGWKTIDVQYIQCDADKARQIMLADNRASDAGYTDESAAFGILATLPTLEGTGYTPEDLELPEIQIDGADWDDGEPREGSEDRTPMDRGPSPQEGTQPFRIGDTRGTLDGDEYGRWRAELPRPAGQAKEVMLLRLGLIDELTTATAPERTIQGQSFHLIRDLVPYPGNPRQGDIGLLMDLLTRHGQYRPIVVNRRNNRILAGNHIAAAAQQLGWERISTVYVDKDEDGEKRILLADNRTSDLASYDLTELGAEIARAGAEHIAGTGYTATDLDDIMGGAQPKQQARTGGTWVQVGDLKAKVQRSLISRAGFTAGQELVEAAVMLQLDPRKITPEQTHQT